MLDTVSFLKEIISGQQIFRIPISDTLKRPILSVFRFKAVHDRHCDLDIRIIHLAVSYEKITFQLSDAYECLAHWINAFVPAVNCNAVKHLQA